MASRRTVTSNSTGWRFTLVVVLFLLLVGGGITGTLFATGFFDAGTAISREGQVAYPTLVRPVSAYDSISREDLLHPQTRELNITWIPEAQVNPVMLRDLGQIIGRVVKRDKQPGYVLTERDFLPTGTRPGISAGIPPGKRSVAVRVSDVPGMELLRQGDLFDLIAVLPSRDEPESNIEQAALLGGVKPPDTRSGQLARQTGIKPLVIAGTMVAITQGKSQSTGGAQGLVVPTVDSRNKTAPEMIATIAVDPVEVAPLTEALGLDVDLYCVARSGHAEEIPSEQETVSLDGLVPVVTLTRPVEAFSQVSQDDLADGVTGKLNVYYFPPEKVQPNWLTGFTDINGRVPAHNLSRGAVIQESDLMPVGTRPGIVGAIPGGMEALFIDVERVIGLDRLSVGDRFEIHSRLPEGFAPSATKPTTASVYGGRLSESDQALQDELRTGMRILSRSALVLQAAGPSTDDDKDSEKVSIAVKVDEARKLIQALQLAHELFAVGRSESTDVEQGGPVAESTSPFSSLSKTSHADSSKGIPVSLVAQTTPVQGASEDARTVSIPILVDDVTPRTRMSVDEFIEPSTGQVRYLQFAPEQVPDNVVRSLREIIGRRSGRQLYGGEWVLREDLCEVPQWSIPRDIPADWSVIELSSLDVRGLEVAEVGDQVDLVAARPVNSKNLLELTSQSQSGRGREQEQRKAWPLGRLEDGFYRAHREDFFTQADIATLVSHAMVVGRNVRVIQVQGIKQHEHVTGESELGDSVERASVQKTRETTFTPVEVTIWQIAVPMDVIPALTEALAVQAVSSDEDEPTRLINRSRLAHKGTEQEEGGESNTNEDETRDHEIAIFAVLRSGQVTTPNSDAPLESRDLVADWMSRWGQRFSEFSKSERHQAKAVRTVQHIRGTAISEDHWLDGRPHDEFPEKAVQSRTIETLIDRKQTQEER